MCSVAAPGPAPALGWARAGHTAIQSDKPGGSVTVGGCLVCIIQQLGLGGQTTALTEEGLPICEVFAPLLEHSMHHPHVCQQGLVPGGGVVTFSALKHLLLMHRLPVCPQVGKIVGTIITIFTLEDLDTRMILFVMLQLLTLSLEGLMVTLIARNSISCNPCHLICMNTMSNFL